MQTKPKLLLGATIVFIVVGALIWAGVVNVRNVPSLYVILPIGVILGGMFLVTKMFEKESQVAVEDQKHALEKAGKHVSSNEVPAKHGSMLAE